MTVFGNVEVERMIRKVLSILSVVLIVGLIVYIGLDQRSQETDDGNVAASPSDIRLYDVVFQSRSDGTKQWEMNADILEQEEKSSYVRLSRIRRWMFYEDDKTIMSVAAAGARVLKRTQEVELEGPIEVLLWIDANKGGEIVE